MLRKRVYGGSHGGRRGKYFKRSVSRRSRAVLYRGIKPELKVIDDNNSGNAPYTTVARSNGDFYPLNFIATGSDFNNRVGRKIMMTSVQVRLKFVSTGVAAVNDFVRVMIVYDKQSNQSTPATSDLIQTIDSAGLASSSVYDFKSVSNEDRFKIIKDESFSFPQLGATMAPSTWSDTMQKSTMCTFNKLNLPAHYGQSSNYPDTGTVWLFIIGSQPLATSPTACQWVTRIRYTDA